MVSILNSLDSSWQQSLAQRNAKKAEQEASSLTRQAQLARQNAKMELEQASRLESQARAAQSRVESTQRIVTALKDALPSTSLASSNQKDSSNAPRNLLSEVMQQAYQPQKVAGSSQYRFVA